MMLALQFPVGVRRGWTIKCEVVRNLNFDLKLFVKKVKDLMAQQGYTKNGIVVKSNIAFDRLDNILLNEIVPTGDEILILSELLYVDFQYLMSNEDVTQFEKTDKLFRTNAKVLSIADKRSLSKILYMAEFAKYLNDTIGVSRFNFQPIIKQKNYSDQGKELASQLRIFLKIENNFSNKDIYKIVRDLGVQVYRLKLSESNISGIHLQNEKIGNVIVVNSFEDAYRQNFTLMHELCHSLLDNNSEYKISFSGQSDKAEEVRANNFAASFLVPDQFIDRISSKSINKEMFLELAKKQFVNPETLSIRLREKGRISPSQHENYKSLKINKREKLDIELIDLSIRGRERVRKIQQTGLSLSYISLLYNAYIDSKISFLKMSEMLFLSPNETESLFEELGWTMNV
ncbi:Zn-dependent peptidase ImmA, M78 family [Acidaminobacter hydrogenoformans DSM 2784]|uniref:Zn-dependent peptidase ImmA, M78 family n=1 Tax=Acidaminobacter hydrogenoformans DSM 2784 TaxID=1120920 RepID=A0A1G5S400_9FIRM|nr:Zn-dependent peptidase ImmA, M78 family [Acidaminobacter hydrogenoformans DSM 2784]